MIFGSCDDGLSQPFLKVENPALVCEKVDFWEVHAHCQSRSNDICSHRPNTLNSEHFSSCWVWWWLFCGLSGALQQLSKSDCVFAIDMKCWSLLIILKSHKTTMSILIPDQSSQKIALKFQFQKHFSLLENLSNQVLTPDWLTMATTGKSPSFSTCRKKILKTNMPHTHKITKGSVKASQHCLTEQKNSSVSKHSLENNQTKTQSSATSSKVFVTKIVVHQWHIANTFKVLSGSHWRFVSFSSPLEMWPQIFLWPSQCNHFNLPFCALISAWHFSMKFATRHVTTSSSPPARNVKKTSFLHLSHLQLCLNCFHVHLWQLSFYKQRIRFFARNSKCQFLQMNSFLFFHPLGLWETNEEWKAACLESSVMVAEHKNSVPNFFLWLKQAKDFCHVQLNISKVGKSQFQISLSFLTVTKSFGSQNHSCKKQTKWTVKQTVNAQSSYKMKI